jgi:hypothetical protein
VLSAGHRRRALLDRWGRAAWLVIASAAAIVGWALLITQHSYVP